MACSGLQGRALAILSRANKKRHTIFTVTKNYNPCGGVLGEPASPTRHSLDLLLQYCNTEASAPRKRPLRSEDPLSSHAADAAAAAAAAI